MNEKKDSKQKGPQNLGHGLDALAALRSRLQDVRRPETPAPCASHGSDNYSVRVGSKRRAGRAPYNFVPLPDAARWLDDDEARLPDFDRFEGLSGWIDLRLTAETDFYIRGMWQDERAGAEAQTRPFEVDGELRLPGSSLRGMLRTLVEILGEAPLDPVNDDQLFFRTVGSNPNPTSRFFEPQAKAYKKRMVASGPQPGPKAQAGYLFGSRDPEKWYIQPAQEDPATGTQWCRVFMDKLPQQRQRWFRGPVWFQVSGFAASICSPSEAGACQGWLVSSGYIQRKRKQWIVFAPDPGAQLKKIPVADVQAYQAGGITPDIRQNDFEYTHSTAGMPCFFVPWRDGKRVSFGHTPYFRLPYERSVKDGIPPQNRREDGELRWDLAQAIFGRVTQHDREAGSQGGARRGRVQVEDALIESGGTVDDMAHPVILGQPKPTTYQHYLVQKSDELIKSIQWDGDLNNEGDVRVRGHKLYLHRPGLPLPPAAKEKVATWLQPARKGARFTSRIRFENLRPWELGALLAALDLPPGCAHRLGMAKPLGLGSFRIEIADIRTIDRASGRYQKMFEAAGTDGDAHLATGASAAGKDDYLKAFAEWFWKPKPAADRKPSIWDHPRLLELRAILTLDGLPDKWDQMTRYLKFGRISRSERLPGEQYNEYNNVGYPDKFQEPRRPLPPASQLLDPSERAKMPDDAEPPFERPPIELRPKRGNS